MLDDEKGAPTGDAPGTKSGEDKAPEKTFTQADIDRIVQERLERAQKKADEAKAKAEAEAAAKVLAEQGEYQKLSEAQKAKLAELEAQTTTQAEALAKASEERDRYQAALKANVAERLKGIPAHITSLLEALDPVDQLAWLTKNAKQIGGVGGAGIEPTPKTSTTGNDAQKRAAATNFERMVRDF